MLEDQDSTFTILRLEVSLRVPHYLQVHSVTHVGKGFCSMQTLLSSKQW
jgi:hypothetical protein